MEVVEAVIDAPSSVPVDFGVHHVLWPRPQNLDAVPQLLEGGVASFKMFLCAPHLTSV